MRRLLGSLESSVMEYLWRQTDAKSVRDVVDGLTERTHAYTTIATVLENLRRKDWLDRERVGRIWFYKPKISASENAAILMTDAFSASDSPRTTLLKFVDEISERETELLRELLDRQHEPEIEES
ncbi:MAG TPA: BlaI/MecI/CopY family transcriptional regulator [Candidatus Stackebrandtia faecavium]|nr:BlaI/MecI/CopY family transcriptional regulator [Candidatus Stackebrandtia faecavium]